LSERQRGRGRDRLRRNGRQACAHRHRRDARPAAEREPFRDARQDAAGALYHTKDARYGGANASRFSNPELDRKIESVPAMNDPAKRAVALAEIWAAAQDEALYVPLYHPTLAYATRSGVEIPADPDDQPKLKLVTFKGP
jgi:ABC-type transport system substrate-binding protein